MKEIGSDCSKLSNYILLSLCCLLKYEHTNNLKFLNASLKLNDTISSQHIGINTDFDNPPFYDATTGTIRNLNILGDATKQTLQNCLARTKSYWPVVYGSGIDTIYQIRVAFKKLGKSMDLDICDFLQSALSDTLVDNLCDAAFDVDARILFDWLTDIPGTYTVTLTMSVIEGS